MFVEKNNSPKRGVAEDMNESTRKKAQREEGRGVQDMKDSPKRKAHRGEVHGLDRSGQVWGHESAN